jgi:glycosyltransferase involved in cell wall biosynthesis
MLLDNEAERKRLAEASNQKAVKHYSLERMLTEYEELYMEIFNNQSVHTIDQQIYRPIL